MNKLLQTYMYEQKELPIVFDYDGVLFEARWYKDTINMECETHEKLIEAYKKGENLYTEPILCMQKVLNKIRGDIYVLSHMHHEIELNFKRSQIAKYFPRIPQDNIIYASSIVPSEDRVENTDYYSKLEYLQDLYKIYGGFIYIDDNHTNLMQLESAMWDYKDTCHFFHVSSLYA